MTCPDSSKTMVLYQSCTHLLTYLLALKSGGFEKIGTVSNNAVECTIHVCKMFKIIIIIIIIIIYCTTLS